MLPVARTLAKATSLATARLPRMFQNMLPYIPASQNHLDLGSSLAISAFAQVAADSGWCWQRSMYFARMASKTGLSQRPSTG